MIQKLEDETGVLHVPVIIIIVFVGVIAFTLGVVYRIQSTRSNIEVTDSYDSGQDELKDADINGIVAVLPEDVEQDDPGEEKQSEPEQPQTKPTSTTTEKQKQDTQTDADKKEHTKPNEIKLTSVSVETDGNSIVLSAQLPKSYSGTCQALVKPVEGGTSSNHKTVKKSINGSSCSVTVPGSKLDGFTEWRTYLSFYSHDGSVKSGWHYAGNATVN